MKKEVNPEKLSLNYIDRHKQAILASMERLKKHSRKHKQGMFALIFAVLFLSNGVATLIYDTHTFENRFASQRA